MKNYEEELWKEVGLSFFLGFFFFFFFFFFFSFFFWWGILGQSFLCNHSLPFLDFLVLFGLLGRQDKEKEKREKEEGKREKGKGIVEGTWAPGKRPSSSLLATFQFVSSIIFFYFSFLSNGFCYLLDYHYHFQSLNLNPIKSFFFFKMIFREWQMLQQDIPLR